MTKAVLRRPLEPAQYTSSDFEELCKSHGIRRSLSRPGQCWDNAVAESFFATLKIECVYRRSFATIDQLRRAIFDYIEIFYNRKRLHSALRYQSPAEYENRSINHRNTSQAA